MPLKVDIDQEKIDKIIRVSREKYGVPREVIEEKIKNWSGENSVDESDEKKEKKKAPKKDKKDKEDKEKPKEKKEEKISQ